MIVTVTMNPAIDKTVEIHQLIKGGLTKVLSVAEDAGGKGINVSKTIKELGGITIATGFLGGGAGAAILKQLEMLGIKSDFVNVSSSTRTNMKIAEANGIVTELNEIGPVISKAELQMLLDKLDFYASEEAIFVISGSVPLGIPTNIYGQIIKMLHSKGSQVFLDASGELLEQAIEEKPDFIKPNIFELKEYFRIEGDLSLEKTVALGKKILCMGIPYVAISLGQDGAIFINHTKVYWCKALPVLVKSTVGAGDGMMAAFTYGISQKMNFEDCVAFAVATATGAVTTEGTKPAKLSLVMELMDQVIITELDDIG